MKRLFIALLAGLVFYACGSQPQQSAETTVEDLLIAEIVSNPLELEDHTVRFEGIIGHICQHSGDKMRVVQQDDNAYSIQVMLGDFASQFNSEFEGMHVVATGVVKTQVRNLDALEEEHDHEHEHEEGHDCASTTEAIERLKARGIDPDIAVYIELTGFEII